MREIDVQGVRYHVDELDRIIKRRGKGFLKSFADKDGYLKYAFTAPGNKTYNISVHRFVQELYNGPIPNGLTIDHIDNDKLNNKIGNLQLLSAEANARKGNVKRWICVSPAGVEYQVAGLVEFCKEHDIKVNRLREVARGYKNRTQHKGWKCYVN